MSFDWLWPYSASLSLTLQTLLENMMVAIQKVPCLEIFKVTLGLINFKYPTAKCIPGKNVFFTKNIDKLREKMSFLKSHIVLLRAELTGGAPLNSARHAGWLVLFR